MWILAFFMYYHELGLSLHHDEDIAEKFLNVQKY